MNRMRTSLSIITLILSQQNFCMFFSSKAIKAYEKKGAKEMFRGHDDLLQEIKSQQNTHNEPKKITAPEQTTLLKGSTDKMNDTK